MHFHVARALEFFINHIVHATAGINQGGSDDGERPAFFKVSGSAEDALGAMKSIGIHAAREHTAGSGHDVVVGAGQTGDGVKQNYDVLLAFGQTFGFFDHHFGDLHVTGGRFIKGTGHHFALNSALHFSHFFRTFVNEQHKKDTVGVIGGNGVSNMLHQNRFTTLRRSNDQSTLTFTDRGNHIDDTAR